jgi:Short C-terminal domain
MLLSQMVRQATVTGRTDYIQSWLGQRQGGRWAQQVQAIVPAATRPRPERLRELDDLHEHGVVTDAEYQQLRARLGA